MLVRSGVAKIRLIDFDQVTLSSLNRHAIAALGDVGQSKAIVLKKRLQEISPWCEIEAVTEMFVGSEARRLLGPFIGSSSGSSSSDSQPPTYVLDCIDDVNTKAELIAYCVKNGLPVLTSMGAGLYPFVCPAPRACRWNCVYVACICCGDEVGDANSCAKYLLLPALPAPPPPPPAAPATTTTTTTAPAAAAATSPLLYLFFGTGGKSDPTRLRVAQLSDCINDPLCSKIKWKLKKHGIAAEDVTGVFSNEKPCVELLPLSDEQAAAPADFGAVDYLRLRVMPVLGTSPALFGQAMASKVLCSLGQTEYVPESCERMSKNLKHKLKQTCRSWEGRRFGYVTTPWCVYLCFPVCAEVGRL